MDIKKLQKNWNEFGKTDPFWSILAYPDKKINKWQINEFFETGIKEIDEVMKYIKSLGIEISRRKALDFGCGVGRLTQALVYYFDEVYGIDIASSMIELANKYNRHGKKCKYYLNETDDLTLFPDNSFDFIYTNITLQHMEPRYSKAYIKEFLRVLIPHGLLIFQLPSKPILNLYDDKLSERLKQLINLVTPKILLNLYYWIKMKIIKQPRMEMYGIKRKEVVKFLEGNRVKIVDITQNKSAGPDWVSFRYCVTKK